MLSVYRESVESLLLSVPLDGSSCVCAAYGVVYTRTYSAYVVVLGMYAYVYYISCILDMLSW